MSKSPKEVMSSFLDANDGLIKAGQDILRVHDILRRPTTRATYGLDAALDDIEIAVTRLQEEIDNLLEIYRTIRDGFKDDVQTINDKARNQVIKVLLDDIAEYERINSTAPIPSDVVKRWLMNRKDDMPEAIVSVYDDDE